uniref:Uncharacterized protein n=1 Tax=Tanacetum cinerariifolium TaxID=118510 RepID=A0A699UWC0_TANCI|nr:hypothetical protein [Tanacetum cinerariifolium]
MNDERLRGLELVKTGIIRLITKIGLIIIHRLTLKSFMKTSAISTTRYTELEVDNRDYNEHRSHKTHKNSSGFAKVGGKR